MMRAHRTEAIKRRGDPEAADRGAAGPETAGPEALTHSR